VRYEKGETDDSGLHPESREACDQFFERQKAGKIYNKNLINRRREECWEPACFSVSKPC